MFQKNYASRVFLIRLDILYSLVLHYKLSDVTAGLLCNFELKKMDKVNGKYRDVSSGKRMLLCRPRGGFNDILCQIHVCWEYAQKFERELYVDTSRSGLLDCFSHYFQYPSFIKFGVPDLRSIQSTVPAELAGVEAIYTVKYKHSIGLYVDIRSDVPVIFDLNRNYSEELLVYEQCGGGENSAKVLSQFQFLPEVKDAMDKWVDQLGNYVALHVRHSDCLTDYKAFFRAVRRSYGDLPFVICTDSYDCQQYALSFFKNIRKTSDTPNTMGRSLHENRMLDRKETNLQMLKDFVTLVHADRLVYTNTTSGSISGFTRLVTNMRKQAGAESDYIPIQSGFITRWYYRLKPVVKRKWSFFSNKVIAWFR